MTTVQGERNSLAAAAVASVCVMGATGLVGRALCASLERAGVKVTRYSRSARPGFAYWDPERSQIDREPLAHCDAVVNLAGEGLGDKRWSKARKQALRDSRLHSTALLARTIAEVPDPPSVLVNVSAVGYYGDRGQEAVYEDSAPGSGFLAELCERWEQATAVAAQAGVRVVIPRMGVVLTPEGGALGKLLPVFRLGLGGRIGSGRQHMPWIAMPDAISVLRFLIVSRDISGPVNAVAPETTTSAQFTNALAHALHRPALFPLPSIALRAALGELSETLLEGADVRPRVLEQAGFRFELPRLEDALEALLPR